MAQLYVADVAHHDPCIYLEKNINNKIYNIYIMKIITYTNINEYSNNTKFIYDQNDNDNDIDYNTSTSKKDITDTKSNIFPEKYIYKHTWLTNGYKSIYKRDYKNHNQFKITNDLPSTLKESKPIINVGKIYPVREIYDSKNIYIKNLTDWNCPINKYI